MMYVCLRGVCERVQVLAEARGGWWVGECWCLEKAERSSGHMSVLGTNKRSILSTPISLSHSI